MKLSALVVDDMPLSRSRVRRYLSSEPDVEISGECGDAETALAEIARLSPDVLFLDVQMPGMTGLGLLERIPPLERPIVVFITAFEEFAVPAFEAQAVDYLLKPFEHERLKQALAKVRQHLLHKQRNRQEPVAAEDKPQVSYLQRIPVKSVGRVTFIETSAIEWIETEGNYLALHCGKLIHFLRETLNHLESQLDPHKFVRIHRSTMVRLDTIHSIQPLTNGDQAVNLKDGERLVLSRSYRGRLKTALGEA